MLSTSRAVHVSQENSGRSSKAKQARKPTTGGRKSEVQQLKSVKVTGEAPRKSQILKDLTNVPKQDKRQDQKQEKQKQEKQCKSEFKAKLDELLDDEYFIPHDMSECNPDTESVFTSKFVPSSAFKNLVTAVNRTSLLTPRYSEQEAPKIPSLGSLHNIKLEQRPIDIFEDYLDYSDGQDTQFDIPELGEFPDMPDFPDIPDIMD